MHPITISGLPGTGTTTIAQLLKKELNRPYVYTGDLFRTLAKKHNMSLEEFGIYSETHREVDEQLDKKQLELLQTDEVILEGRIAGWIAYKNKIPAFKILLTADLTTRAQRLVKREGGSVEQRKQEILERERSEKMRYKQYYDIDLEEQSIYDVVIDSSDKPPEKIVQIILSRLKN